jgi:CRISPR-associated endoribonuclease Cas6
MRIYLNTTKNTKIVPYNYQSFLSGALHKWLGINEEHDDTSLYSFSWLTKAKSNENGLNFPEGSQWFISAFNPDLIRRILKGIQNDPSMFAGIEVNEVTIAEEPHFKSGHVFKVANPVFIKRQEGERKKFYYFNDTESTALLTETLAFKLEKAGLDSENVLVEFTTENTSITPKTKGFTHKNIFNKGSICPVKIHGTYEQLAFAWNVGVGSSTGIGFGALI